MKKFLVISPHPDDLDFGCGGTIAKLVKEKNKIEELIVTDGSKGSQVLGFGGRKLVEIRKQEQKNAASVLGAKTVYFFNERDGEMENTKDLRQRLVAFLRLKKPDVVISQEPFFWRTDRAGILHRDHRETAQAVFDAVYPAVENISFFPELLRRNLKPHRVQELWFWGSLSPNLVIDISKTIEQKIQALVCHKTQIKDPAALESRIREWAKNMGKKKGMRYAEGFRVLKLL